MTTMIPTQPGETLECGTRASMQVSGIAALITFILGAGFCSFSYFTEEDPYHPFGILMLALCAFLLFAFIQARARWNKFGLSRLRFTAQPLLGKEFRCTLSISGDFQPTGDFKFVLLCKERVTRGTGKKRSTSVSTKWKEEKRISPLGKSPRAGIAVQFMIAPQALPSGTHESEHSVFWELDISAPAPGVNYFASFQLWVWESAEALQKELAALEEEEREHPSAP